VGGRQRADKEARQTAVNWNALPAAALRRIDTERRVNDRLNETAPAGI